MLIETLGAGGAERALVNLLPELAARGHGVTVCALAPPYDLASEFGSGVDVVTLDGRLARGSLRPVVALGRAVRARHPDVVIGHLFYGALVAALSRPLAPSPLRVAVFHNLGYDSYPANTPKRRLAKFVNAMALRTWIDGRVAVSEAVAAHYRRHLRLGPMTVIPNAVTVTLPEPTHRAAIRARFGAGPGVALLVSPGRFVHEKGHRDLVEAARLLRQRGVNYRLVLVGAGPERERVAGLTAEQGLGSSIEIRDPMPHAALLDLVAAADLLVGASTHEGQPLVPAEALALGTAVVTTAVGGIPEIIRSEVDGILVPARDAAALAREIERLIGDVSLRSTLAESGRRRVRALLGAPSIAAEWERYLTALVKSPRSGGIPRRSD